MRHLASGLAVVLVPSLAVFSCSGNVVRGTDASGTGGAVTTTSSTTTSTITTSSSTTSSSTTTSSTTSSSTTTFPTGDCQTDADCNGGQCVELTPGGYKVCAHIPPQATACTPSPLDECCTSADCKGGGKCYAASVFPYCGGPAFQPQNVCVTDQCTDDASCNGDGGAGKPMICTPAGTVGSPARSCLTAYCHTDADCTARPGGACLLVHDPCCPYPDGLGCVYPGGCVRSADCGQGTFCQLDRTTGTGKCVAGFPMCPV
jgi:hypothetical protein